MSAMDQLTNFVKRSMQPLKDRVLLMIGRALITAVNDGAKVQQVQVKALAEESLDKVEHFQNFGFSSNPPAGTEGIYVCLSGNRENMVIVATENRNVRVKNLASGESVIYTDDGTKIHLKKAGQIEIVTAVKVKITAPDVEMTGNLKVDGTLDVAGAATLESTLDVGADASIGGNAAVTGAVAAASYSGPSGGPMVASADIQTSGNVSGGGTDLATIKSTFNTHTHPENGTGGGTTSPPNSSL